MEDRLRKMDEANALQVVRASHHASEVQDRAVVANQLLRELAAEALPVLKTRNHGRFLDVTFAAPTISIGSEINYKKIRILPGETIWRTTHASGYTGINESGILVQTKTVQFAVKGKRVAGNSGESFLNQRANEMAQKMGFDGVRSGTPITAYGEPQRGKNSDVGDPAVFFLAESGKLVFGTSLSATDAEEWMAKAIF